MGDLSLFFQFFMKKCIPCLATLNNLYQCGKISESHLLMQEIEMFTDLVGNVSTDPIRGLTDAHKRYPAAVLFQEHLRDSSSGREAYNIYLGKHNLGIVYSPLSTNHNAPVVPHPASINHAGLSKSTWFDKSVVPVFTDGVIINFIEVLMKMIDKIDTVKLESQYATTIYCTLMFDIKAISPGGEVFGGTGFGIQPPLNAEEAKNLCDQGYKTFLEWLISIFKSKERTWVKSVEVYMVQFLDIKVAVPIATFSLEKEGDAEDLYERVTRVLKYLTSCNNCLLKAKHTGLPPKCTCFCMACMRERSVCQRHEHTDEWCPDLRPCRERNVKAACVRFNVLLTISDQAPPYEKFGRSVSTSLQNFLDGFGKYPHPFRHIHDIGHHLKNAQASLERGTNFDGKYTYDSRGLWVLSSTGNDAQCNALFE